MEVGKINVGNVLRLLQQEYAANLSVETVITPQDIKLKDQLKSK